MSRTLTRPMFRKGGMAQREKYMGGGIKAIRPRYMGGGMTGIMSGIQPDAGLTPRTGYAEGSSLQELIAGEKLQQPGTTVFTEDYIKNEFNQFANDLYNPDLTTIGGYGFIDSSEPLNLQKETIKKLISKNPEQAYEMFKKGELGNKTNYVEKQKEQKEVAKKAGVNVGFSDASDANELDDVDTLDTKDKFRRIFD